LTNLQQYGYITNLTQTSALPLVMSLSECNSRLSQSFWYLLLEK